MSAWRVLDLFSGIGGFSLGLERAGMRTVAFCEIEPFCRAVLRKHWPTVPIYEDVRELDAVRLRADGIGVDVICGGFPCQDISLAGKGAGIEGERSGLWREYARLVGEIGPRWVVIENVPALRTRGADRVLGDLEALGYAATPLVVGADDVGAPHRRKRAWIVAYADDARLEGRHGGELQERAGEFAAGQGGASMEDAAGEGRHSARGADAGEANGGRPLGWSGGSSGWRTEPAVGRVAHGIPARVDRLRALGNAVVPQIPEAIGRAIMRTAACPN